MVKVKEEPVVDQLELRYRGDSPEADNNVECYQVGSISDQTRAIWGEEEEEVKPKAEQIGIDPNRQVVIKLDRDFLRKNYRAKWIDHVSSTYRHPGFKKACQLCPPKIVFDKPEKLIEHYEEFHKKETTWYNCTVCNFSTRRQKNVILHWERKHEKKSCNKKRTKSLTTEKYNVSRLINDQKNKWTGDDELVHSMFYKEAFECDICFKTFSYQCHFDHHNILYHLKENEIKTWYKCDLCDKRFRRKRNLRGHIKNVHREKLSCAFCSREYSTEIQLRRHELKHRNEMLTCEFCDVKFISKLAQIMHYRKLHFGLLRHQDKLNGGLNKWFQGNRTYECYRCRFSGNCSKVKDHMPVCKYKGNNPIDCKDKNCIRRFDTLQRMKKHYKLTHDKILDLMNVPQNRRTYECYICRYTETGFHSLLLKKHLKKEHPQNYKCEICQKQFKWLSNYSFHVRGHSGEKPFQCKICNAKFLTLYRLEKHCLIHGEKLFKCTYCPKRFHYKSHIKRHEKSMHNENNLKKKNTLDLMNVPQHRRTFECYICRYTKKGFHWFLLKKHLRKEHPEDYKCDICNATFRNWSLLEQHKLLHGKRKFKCKYCPTRFHVKYGLKKHEKIHTKPVKCERCDFRCARKESLTAHIKNHCTGKKMKKNVK